MDTINYSIVAFFGAAATMLGYLGVKFRTVRKQPAVNFGTGLLLISLAFYIWTYIVAVHPENMKFMVELGMLPLAASFVIFLLVATHNVKAKHKLPLYLINASILTLFLFARYFVYSSNPGFTENGYFAFNVDPVVIYFYALILSFNFIPALYVIGRMFKNDVVRIGIELGLTLVAVGLIVMVTSKDEGLQFLNGIGMLTGLLAASAAVAHRQFTKNAR